MSRACLALLFGVPGSGEQARWMVYLAELDADRMGERSGPSGFVTCNSHCISNSGLTLAVLGTGPKTKLKPPSLPGFVIQQARLQMLSETLEQWQIYQRLLLSNRSEAG